MGYPPFPAQSAHLCQYAAFLARTLKPSSIPNYLNIIGVLHKKFNLPNPLTDNWLLQSLLTGIKRVKGEPPSQKLPITPDLLPDHPRSQPNLRTSIDSSFWAICLVYFYGMLRKSHLLVKSSGSLDISQQLLSGYCSLEQNDPVSRAGCTTSPSCYPRLPPALLWLLSAHGTSRVWHPQTPKPLHFLNSPDLQLKVFSYPLFLRNFAPFCSLQILCLSLLT